MHAASKSQFVNAEFHRLPEWLDMKDDPKSPLYRILDASVNRASEGLRTLEEYARFVLDHPGLTARLKRLRHDLVAALAPLPRSKRLAARDTLHDVGTQITVASEMTRRSTSEIIAAATSRTQQSLRCLEEYSKPLDPRVASAIEQLRYQAYTLFAELEQAPYPSSRHERLAAAGLYVLLGASESAEAFTDKLITLLGAGVDVIQLRDRGCDDRTLFERAVMGSRIARDQGALFIVNDRPDIAAAANADGVHVGQDELPASAARQIIGPTRLLGISTHSLEQAHQAVVDGADYLGCGPMFPGRTKTFPSYVGPALLRQVVREISLPIFAIGGIDQTNVAEIVAAGCHRIAVTGAIRDAPDPVAAAKRLQAGLGVWG